LRLTLPRNGIALPEPYVAGKEIVPGDGNERVFRRRLGLPLGDSVEGSGEAGVWNFTRANRGLEIDAGISRILRTRRE